VCARVVNTLGRQQIADVPPAISGLLKNSADALADTTEGRFNSRTCFLQIEYSGHGMRTKDLLEKWLVLATESKQTRMPDPMDALLRLSASQ
jgi:hypothetical protein